MSMGRETGSPGQFETEPQGREVHVGKGMHGREMEEFNLGGLSGYAYPGGHPFDEIYIETASGNVYGVVPMERVVNDTDRQDLVSKLDYVVVNLNESLEQGEGKMVLKGLKRDDIKEGRLRIVKGEPIHFREGPTTEVEKITAVNATMIDMTVDKYPFSDIR